MVNYHKNTEGVQNYKRLIINEIIKRLGVEKRKNTEGVKINALSPTGSLFSYKNTNLPKQ